MSNRIAVMSNGLVQQIGSTAWTVSGITVVVSETTEIEAGLQVGDLVRVEGHILPDGTWLVDEIKRAPEFENRFEFSGIVQSRALWTVSGITFTTTEQTEIDAGIEIGDRVKVEGRILADGTWLAEEIRLLDEQPLTFVFIGQVTHIDPWVVSGITFTVNSSTTIESGIVVGDRVRVTGIVQSDGSLLAQRIEMLDEELGCTEIRVKIVAINGNQLVLSDGQTIELTDSLGLAPTSRANSPGAPTRPRGRKSRLAHDDEKQLEQVRERFFREAESAGRLSHPNIVTIYDVGEEGDLAYIAMDYLPGVSLDRHTAADTLLPVEEVMAIILQVAGALDYAHSNGVIHRDIKPANIIYDSERREATVTDFGVAHLADASKPRTGTILGSPYYMAPEQLAGAKVDGRADLFSLGVTFYQLLTGAMPFEADSITTLMYKIANSRHVSVSRLRRGVPNCTVRIVNQLLQKDAEKRYQSGTDLHKALERCLK